MIAPATWQRASDGDVEIREDGVVLEDGDEIFLIDRVGRVVDEDREPVAILLSDGSLVGTNNRWWGRVGVSNASPPGQDHAWLSVMPNGEVVYFDSDGERTSGGAWRGCGGRAMRTCTLVTHLLAMQKARSQPHMTFVVSTGVGL